MVKAKGRPSAFAVQQRKFATPKLAFRSGLEDKVAQQIAGFGLPVYFERFKVPYTKPQAFCKYTPDFVLPNGIVIESKGLFQTEDRQKHILVKGQYPDLDIRFIFSNANAKIAKKSPTTYAMWCDKQAIPWANRVMPATWATEAPNEASIAALKKLGWAP